MSTLQHWLDHRLPEAPAALSERIAQVIAAHPEWNALPHAQALVLAAEALLADVLVAAPKDRGAARDLLAADACVTYALEAASDEPATFDKLTLDMMQRIARY